MKHALLITLGCKTNQYEGEMLLRGLREHGILPADDGASPDLAVVNTCTVTMRADRKCRQAIRGIASRHPGVPIYVTGCYAGRDAKELSSLDGVAGVAAGKDELLRMIARNVHPSAAAAPPEPSPPSRRRARAFLKIQDGCDAFCTYCIVPHVRPTLRSEPLEGILREAERLVRAGFREIVLTGIHLGRYGADRPGGPALVEVVRRVASTAGLLRLRLSSIEMPEVADDLAELIAQNPVLCPHLHLPLQSGDDGVLAAMNRRYAAADFLDTARRLRRRIPSLSITTDVIVGFPGETEEAFENTLRLAREVGFSKIHVFPYSVRPGTAAAKLPRRVPPRVVTARKKRLLRLADDLALDVKRRFLGKTVPVLVEESKPAPSGLLLSSGFTEYYLRVRFGAPADLVDRLVHVVVESVTPRVMEGRLAEPPQGSVTPAGQENRRESSCSGG